MIVDAMGIMPLDPASARILHANGTLGADRYQLAAAQAIVDILL